MWQRKREKGVESKQALAGATERLKKTQARDPEVKEVARAFKLIRERNHLAEKLEFIMGGGQR